MTPTGRVVEGEDPSTEELIRRARELGAAAETTRRQMLVLAAERQALLLRLHEERGLSLRRIAGALEVSLAVVAAGVRAARSTRTGRANARPPDASPAPRRPR